MSGDQITDVDTFDAPFGRQITLQEVAYESGLVMLRLRIREGSRFTIIELDSETAKHWGKTMSKWAANAANPA
jgi:hypothetical protein